MTLFFTEFANIARSDNAGDAVVQCAANPTANGSITLTGSNQQSSAFGSTTRLVRVVATVASYISFGASPNATSDVGRIYMAAGTTEYFAVSPAHKIAGVTA